MLRVRVMSYRTNRALRAPLLAGCSLLVLVAFGQKLSAQERLPDIVVEAPKQVTRPQRPKPGAAASRRPASRPTVAASTAPPSAAAQLAAQGEHFDQARSNIFTTI